MKGPIVEEVRKHRIEHTQKFGGDLFAICEDLRSIQAASGHKIVRLESRKPEYTNASSRRKKARS